METNETDPIPFASICGHSEDLVELCKIFLLDVYMKHFGRNRGLILLNYEHDRKNPNWFYSFQLMLLLFALTWLLKSPIYRLVSGLIIGCFNWLAGFNATSRRR